MHNLFVKTFGCQMNEYDSNKMIDLLNISCGLKLTNHEAHADMFILNTCSVREKAQEKLFHQLGRWHKYKKNNPHKIIAVGGCVASQEGELILKRAPFVDIIFGPQTLHRLPNMLRKVLDAGQIQIDISFPEIEKFDNLPTPKSNGVSAFVSIMEGCSKYCTFCVVPYTRGEEVSRPFNDVIAEIKALSANGTHEVTLLGQNVNAYKGLMDDGAYADLALLIEIIANIKNIYRIRYTTSHPIELDDRIINAYKNTSKLVSHLHLPIQSGSDKILTMMKRGYSVLEYKSKIKKLRTVRPNLSLSSDFIVGFPNETEDDFDKTMALIKEINFDRSFSFIYSKRPGTPAAGIFDNISLEIKKKRLAKMQASLNRQMQFFSEKMIGTTQNILVEGYSPRGNTLFGRSENNRVVHFHASDKVIGEMVQIKILRANPNSLIGKII